MTEIIGIIGAMDVEVENFKSAMSDIQKVTISGMDFYSGKMFNKNVVVVKSGVGKVFAGLATEILCLKFNANCIINTGVAGSVSGIKIGETVISSAVCQHDMDTSALGDLPGLISGINKIYLPADMRLINLAERASRELGLSYHTGIIASGDKFVSDAADKERISSSFTALCVEMEGGAVGQASYINSTPFLVIRTISDDGDENHQVEFFKFAKESADKSFKLVSHIIENF